MVIGRKKWAALHCSGARINIHLVVCNINNIFMFNVVVIVEVQICGGAVQKNSVVYRWYMMGLNPRQTGGNESNKR